MSDTQQGLDRNVARQLKNFRRIATRYDKLADNLLYGHKCSEDPASEEAGRVDLTGSIAVATGPDQDEAVIALAFHQ